MHKNKKILGLITARGGSKGIPRKNIKVLAGKPLVAYSIEAGEASRLLTRCIVSSEDAEIIEISKKFGADVPFVRPLELAQDSSTSLAVVQHAVSWLKDNCGEEYDYVMILQPTSPLRTAQDIDEAIKMVVDTGADSVMGMKELGDCSINKFKKIVDGVILPLFEDEGAFSTRRQDIDQKIYKRNGAIYVTKTELMMQGDLFGKTSLAHIMPEERSVDINILHDFIVAEAYLK
ncbi:MAG: acylneuraminate cytidylyltransferase family protein [Patescibacteria group bacterium]